MSKDREDEAFWWRDIFIAALRGCASSGPRGLGLRPEDFREAAENVMEFAHLVADLAVIELGEQMGYEAACRIFKGTAVKKSEP